MFTQRLPVLGFLFLFLFFLESYSYLLLINENQEPGTIIFNSSVYKLGSDRHYKINLKRSAAFVNNLLFVEPKSGKVYLRQSLICDGIYYPNLFTLYIDSTSNHLRAIEYYSLPLRILVVGDSCIYAQESWNDKHFSEENRRKREVRFEDEEINESSNEEDADDTIQSRKREVSSEDYTEKLDYEDLIEETTDKINAKQESSLKKIKDRRKVYINEEKVTEYWQDNRNEDSSRRKLKNRNNFDENEERRHDNQEEFVINGEESNINLEDFDVDQLRSIFGEERKKLKVKEIYDKGGERDYDWEEEEYADKNKRKNTRINDLDETDFDKEDIWEWSDDYDDWILKKEITKESNEENNDVHNNVKKRRVERVKRKGFIRKRRFTTQDLNEWIENDKNETSTKIGKPEDERIKVNEWLENTRNEELNQNIKKEEQVNHDEWMHIEGKKKRSIPKYLDDDEEYTDDFIRKRREYTKHDHEKWIENNEKENTTNFGKPEEERFKINEWLENTRNEDINQNIKKEQKANNEEWIRNEGRKKRNVPKNEDDDFIRKRREYTKFDHEEWIQNNEKENTSKFGKPEDERIKVNEWLENTRNEELNQNVRKEQKANNEEWIRKEGRKKRNVLNKVKYTKYDHEEWIQNNEKENTTKFGKPEDERIKVNEWLEKTRDEELKQNVQKEQKANNEEWLRNEGRKKRDIPMKVNNDFIRKRREYTKYDHEEWIENNEKENTTKFGKPEEERIKVNEWLENTRNEELKQNVQKEQKANNEEWIRNEGRKKRNVPNNDFIRKRREYTKYDHEEWIENNEKENTSKFGKLEEERIKVNEWLENTRNEELKQNVQKEQKANNEEWIRNEGRKKRYVPNNDFIRKRREYAKYDHEEWIENNEKEDTSKFGKPEEERIKVNEWLENTRNEELKQNVQKEQKANNEEWIRNEGRKKRDIPMKVNNDFIRKRREYSKYDHEKWIENNEKENTTKFGKPEEERIKVNEWLENTRNEELNQNINKEQKVNHDEWIRNEGRRKKSIRKELKDVEKYEWKEINGNEMLEGVKNNKNRKFDWIKNNKKSSKTYESHIFQNIQDIHSDNPWISEILSSKHPEYSILKHRKKRNIENDFYTNADRSTRNRISEARQWISETYASFAIPSADKFQKICLKKSQYINSISAFLPKTIVQQCSVNYMEINDDRFIIEKSQGDLVANKDMCITQPLWKIIITFSTHCKNSNVLDSEHRLKIVYHHQEFNDTDIGRRVRRELRNQSPFFEQALYMASVLEECDPGVIVTTVKARDPENSPVTYQMTSLLDSRTQGMFDIDPKQGTVTTKVKLDRELLDVHYFRVTAVDDSFPPRSGTTTLQINVLDANDHSPVFEMNEYDASIREGVSIGSTVITLKASDQDVGKNADVEYSVSSITGGGMSTPESDNQAFRVDSRTGVITTRTLLDRELTEVYTIIVQASDMASPQSARRTSTASVVVRILDDNDNYPQFTERTYTVPVNEDTNWSENPVVAHVKATDADQGNNAAIRYAIIGGNTQSQFSIDSLTGDVSLVKPLDYESIRSYRLVIRAQDGGSPSRSNTTQLLINVKDVNDNAPRFYTSLFQESVTESVPIGYSIVRVQAYDADEGPNSEIRYSLAPRDSSGASTGEIPLSVDAHNGWIVTTRELDREEQNKYMFQVIASDQGKPQLSASASVVVSIQDINDNDPVFEPKLYEAVISEDDPPGTPVASVTASDLDEDQRLHYELTGGNTRGRFAITSQNGRGFITVAQPLDYKQEKRYILTVTASDSGGRHDTATVYVNVSDANNYAPVFENAPYSASVFEDAPVGTTVLVVSATDNDVGINAQITYSLGDELSGSNDHSSEFSINSQTGAIITTKALDRETMSGYLLTVTAKDGGNPPLSDTTDIEISVTDVNDNFPMFKQQSYSGSILEDALIGTSVVQVSATDSDMGLNGRIRYMLSDKDSDDGTFVIDPTSGVIRTNKGLDRESVASYAIQAIAVDRGSPSLTSEVPVTIRIEDINDSPPAFDTDKIILYIPENSPIGSTVGQIYAADPDEGVNAIVQYSIIGGDDSNSFSLVTRPGSEKAELLTMTELDYESARKKYDLVVRAASPPLRSDVHVEIIVTDVNDNAPILKDFHVMFNNFRDCFPTGAIGRIPAFDADISDHLRFRILSGNNAHLVALNESTGELHLSPQLNTNVPKIASMDVSVTDGVNDVKAVMQLTVRLITEDMLFNSITVRLNYMTKEAFLSPLLGFFIDGLAAIIPCPKENIFLFSIQDDTDVNAKILNVSFSARRPDVSREEYYSPQFLQERVYLNRAILARLSTVQVLPFDDNLCVREPCLNYEECLTVLKFGNASEFIHSDTVLFRPIYPVTTFACRCPDGFTGSREHYLCDTEVNLCYSNPCKNNGTCYRKEGGFTCGCLPGFTGTNCEIILNHDPCKRDVCKSGSICTPLVKGGFVCEDCSPNGGYEHYTSLCELRSRSFGRGSFLTFPSLRQRHRLHISLQFATQSMNGLLFYNGRYNEKHDFIALEIVDGDVQFSFSLGSNITRTTVTISGGVADGKWHTVEAKYYNKTATVSLDNCDTSLAIKHGQQLGWKWACANRSEQVLESRCAVLTETCHRFLDLTGPLQIGGLPKIPSSFQVNNRDYEGCIKDLFIDHKFVDLNTFVADNGTTSGCPEKREFCNSQPCRNGGYCREGWSTYKCECTAGFGGKECTDIITQPWRFSGDGMLSFNPLLRPIQLPWLNAISVRTLQADTFLMSVQVGQNSSAVVALNSGLLHYSYNGISLNLTSKPLSDGSWHHLEITWLGTEIRLNVDYGQHITTAAFAPKIQGLYVGKILIGGPDTTYSSLSAGYSYFEGCIQDVRIGNQQISMGRPAVRENIIDGCIETAECTAQCPSTADCVSKWSDSHCECRPGYVGPQCASICSVSPCEEGGTCIQDASGKRGYECRCNGSEYSGEYCETKLDQPCPSGWWGYPVCGPCSCDTAAGYNPDCDKSTGECHCKENHWRPAGSHQCLPCDCYTIGSYSPQCDLATGQCRCRSGVIGRRCDGCTNNYAEVTLRGCEVVYDGCPRSFSDKLWWPRTPFGQTSIETCPKGAHGKGSRSCDNQLGGWQLPDMFNCTSDLFVELRKQLSQIEKEELMINTYVAVKMASDLHHATNLTLQLYGADVLITQQLIRELIKHEANERGLNLTHSQDKDYISNLVNSASVVLNEKYMDQWKRIEELTTDSSEALIVALTKYIDILANSQRDTYTNPFEIVSNNIALGLDVVTPVSLFGYEPESLPISSSDQTYTTERVIIPDTSDFLKPGIEISSTIKPSPVIAFPKYNNYLREDSKFDMESKFLVPLSLLGIKPLEVGEMATKHSISESGAIVSYAQYKQAGMLLPERYDESVMRRWGVDVLIGSPVISLSILVPEYVEAVTRPPITSLQPPKQKKTSKKSFSDSETKNHENSAYIIDDTLSRRKRDEYQLSKKLMYKSLAGIPLPQSIRLTIRLDSDRVIFNERSNPQCVHWSKVRGKGEWSRVGCRTELEEDWTEKIPLMINCTCNHLSTFAVLVDLIDLEYIPEPSLLEDVSSYSCFAISLPLLFATWCILALIRGIQTNSNTIHKNLVLCVFLAQLLYFIALKARKPLVENMFPCKLTAISLHYLFLCVFAWNLVDSVHLYRMLTEMRDINHGQMPFYFSVGYVVPAVVVSLPVGARVDQYGNYLFCWLSLYESVVWSLIGPVCAMAVVNLVVLTLSVRAAFTLKDHVMGFGNLRTLLWLSVISLPLLVMMWVLALLMASDHSPMLTYLLSLVVLIHSIFAILGYCFVNQRVRQNLLRSVMYCMGKKVPLLETTSVMGGASTSSHNISMQASRSALAYHNTGAGFEPTRRHIGISTSSTTSRSTTKTGSSPYRSDTHLRHTSTSTSNYNSTSDVPSYLRGFDNEALHRHREVLEESERRRGDSDSESDGSEGRSLELASSHSSDDDESSSSHRRHRLRNVGVSTVGYLPNITEHVVSPPALNIVTNSQLFPNVYGGRWSSQLPESYLGNTNEIGRWSAETASDNEVHCHKTSSPNPLPNPDVTPESYLPKSLDADSQYTQRYLNTDPHYVQKLMKNDYHAKMSDNFHDYGDGSETEEKHYGHDKYLFPYTAEEDHCGTHTTTYAPTSRMLSPSPRVVLTNDVNNPGGLPEYPRASSVTGSRMGSVMGSVCGSIRGSPSLNPMVGMMPGQQDSEKDANAETSV